MACGISSLVIRPSWRGGRFGQTDLLVAGLLSDWVSHAGLDP